MSLNGLEKITDKILADANERAAKILADSEAECERIRAEYEAKAAAIRDRLLSEAESEGMAHVARAKADASNLRRNLLLEKQSELIDGVFDAALENTKKLPDASYIELLSGLLSAAFLEQIETEQAVSALGGDEESEPIEAYELLLNARDRERCGVRVIEETKKHLQNKAPAEKLDRLVLGEKPVSIDGGLILRAGAVEANCSLSLLFALLREELEAEVSRALFEARGQA